ncbi:lanC-like protein 3, partial [Saccoglossus kowalevskii]|uniref:LanC-like protein 3-like n=1 Tax=Saccoglossus kowalevskii TaxID=10224 RepID=A0ABM0H1N7_SACKO
MRYFVNTLKDFVPGSVVHVPKEVIYERVNAVCQQIARHQEANFDNADGGLYVGPAGLACAFYRLASSGNFQDKKSEHLARAQEYLSAHDLYLKKSRIHRTQQAGLLLGNGGVYMTGALLYKTLGDDAKVADYVKMYIDLAAVCEPVRFLKCGSDELFVGRAGYLCGVLYLNKALGTQVIPNETAHALCNSMVASGRDYSKRHRSPIPLMYAYYDTEYLGAAHGLSAILQILMHFPSFFKSDPSIEKDIRESVDFFLKIETSDGNYAPSVSECYSKRPVDNELVHWCHGAPGVVYLLAKAYLTWNDSKYMEACLRCGELTWQRGLLRKGPGI